MFFVNIDLPPVWRNFDWRIFKNSSHSIIRHEKDHYERLEAIRLAILTNHIEILNQSLCEHIKFFSEEHLYAKYLKNLGYFLLALRNAFVHTKGVLLPKYCSNKPLWTNKKLKKTVFKVVIPVKKTKGMVSFDPSSSFSIRLTWKNINLIEKSKLMIFL